jgi:hypothetical protein
MGYARLSEVIKLTLQIEMAGKKSFAKWQLPLALHRLQ